jgi:hypothetical protein
MDANRKSNEDPDPERYRHTFSEPGFFTYPGDTLTVTIGRGNHHEFALADRAGQPIGHGFLSHLNFHLISGGSGGAPVRAQPDAQSQPHPERLTLQRVDPDTGAVTHDHEHYHPPHANAFPTTYQHPHAHTHTGADAARATVPGHTVDIHEHDHESDAG